MSRLTFTIVENPTLDIDMDELKTLYLDPTVSIDDICKKYKISKKKYYTIIKDVARETGIPYKPNLKNSRSLEYNEMKNIYFIELTGTYRINYRKNKKTLYFGEYKDLDTAKEVRGLLIDHNWDEQYYEKVIKPKYHPKPSSETPEDFETDFMSGMAVKDLMTKYSLTGYRYKLLANQVKMKYGIRIKPRMGAIQYQ